MECTSPFDEPTSTSLMLPPPLSRDDFETAFTHYCTYNDILVQTNRLRVDGRLVDLHALHYYVIRAGGASKVAMTDAWPKIGAQMGFVYTPAQDNQPALSSPEVAEQISDIYEIYLSEFDRLYMRDSFDDEERFVGGFPPIDPESLSERRTSQNPRDLRPTSAEPHSRVNSPPNGQQQNWQQPQQSMAAVAVVYSNGGHPTPMYGAPAFRPAPVQHPVPLYRPAPMQHPAPLYRYSYPQPVIHHPTYPPLHSHPMYAPLRPPVQTHTHGPHMPVFPQNSRPPVFPAAPVIPQAARPPAAIKPGRIAQGYRALGPHPAAAVPSAKPRANPPAHPPSQPPSQQGSPRQPSISSSWAPSIDLSGKELDAAEKLVKKLKAHHVVSFPATSPIPLEEKGKWVTLINSLAARATVLEALLAILHVLHGDEKRTRQMILAYAAVMYQKTLLEKLQPECFVPYEAFESIQQQFEQDWFLLPEKIRNTFSDEDGQVKSK